MKVLELTNQRLINLLSEVDRVKRIEFKQILL